MKRKILFKFKECKICGKIIKQKTDICKDCKIYVEEEYNPERFDF